MMKRIKLNFFDLDEISSREFDFSVLIIMLCIAFRNYFRGYGFAIHLTSDLFFEMTLLLLPVSLLLFNKRQMKKSLIHYKVIYLSSFNFREYVLYRYREILIYLAHKIPIIDFIFSLFGLVMLIAGIINILISILIFVTKQRVKQSASKNRRSSTE